MSGSAGANATPSLPARPSLEHLKKQARRRLREVRARDAGARLADAQHQLARDYGFPSWRALKAFVDSRAGAAGPFGNLVGFYGYDPHFLRNGVVGVEAQDGRLVLEAVTGARFELSPAGDGLYQLRGVPGLYAFDGGENRPASALIARGRFGEARLERIAPGQAQAIRAARELALAEQARPRTEIPVPRQALERCAGHYAAPVGATIAIACEGERLLAQVSGQPPFEVFPESETRFFYRVTAAQLAFELEGGRAVAVVLHQHGIEQRLDRVTAEAADRVSAYIRESLAEQQQPRTRAEIDPALPPRYAGRYKADAGRVLEVQSEDGRLFVQITGQPRFEVFPEADDTFFWTVVAAQISFVGGADGRITHAVLHQMGRDTPLPRLEDAPA